MKCKCGNESKGTELVKHYKRRDGTMTTYVQKEKRCSECFNKATRIANEKIRKAKKKEAMKQEFIGYL